MTFDELKLSAPVLRAVREAGYETPSPIQAQAIPPVLKGRDLMGCAQTGTGKTAAFALPMLDRLSAAPARRQGAIRALILTPTRELALQIGDSFAAYGKYLPLRSTVIFGGVGQGPQVEALRKGVDVLIACPGRLNDLIGQGLVDLSGIEIFVLDEADRMLDMGFVHDVKKVIAKLPAKRQNLMFSATMPAEIEQLAGGILRDPAFVKVDPPSSTVDRIDQSLYFVEKGNKKLLLPWLIKTLDPPVQNALVFSRTKHGADKIARDLNKQGITAAAIHGNKSQSARVAALEGFKAGRTQVLVATDIAARGIDISELSHVFNYDLPEVPETYVHRIGRTARAGADGTAVSFCCPEEREYLTGIEKLNRKKIPVISGHPWEGAPAPVRPEPPTRLRKVKPEAEPQPQPAVKEPGPREQKAAKSSQPPRTPARAEAAIKPDALRPQKVKKEEKAMSENQNQNTKRASGGRNDGRRSNNTNRGRRDNAEAAPARSQNQQPRFDPHFVSAPEATPLRPAKKTAPAQRQPKAPGPAAQNANQGGQPSRRERGAQTGGKGSAQNTQSSASSTRTGRSNGRPQNTQPAAQTAGAAGSSANSGSRSSTSRSMRAETRGRGSRPAERDEDPGLLLISRRPPQQKFTNFEEYMTAHGGATAPIEDHSEEI